MADSPPAAGPHTSLAFLRSELAAADVGSRSLYVIHLEVPNAARVPRRHIVDSLRHTLRPSDRVFDLGRDGMLIALPRTGPAAAAELASEITEALRAQAVESIGAPTSANSLDPHELIAHARARSPVQGSRIPLPTRS
ncbi:MAG: hypothetical protein ACYDHH_23295 [Solirubrobacteraceae bacterium]